MTPNNLVRSLLLAFYSKFVSQNSLLPWQSWLIPAQIEWESWTLHSPIQLSFLYLVHPTLTAEGFVPPGSNVDPAVLAFIDVGFDGFTENGLGSVQLAEIEETVLEVTLNRHTNTENLSQSEKNPYLVIYTLCTKTWVMHTILKTLKLVYLECALDCSY